MMYFPQKKAVAYTLLIVLIISAVSTSYAKPERSACKEHDRKRGNCKRAGCVFRPNHRGRCISKEERCLKKKKEVGCGRLHYCQWEGEKCILNPNEDTSEEPLVKDLEDFDEEPSPDNIDMIDVSLEDPDDGEESEASNEEPAPEPDKDTSRDIPEKPGVITLPEHSDDRPEKIKQVQDDVDFIMSFVGHDANEAKSEIETNMGKYHVHICPKGSTADMECIMRNFDDTRVKLITGDDNTVEKVTIG